MNVERFIEARKQAGFSQQELSEGICTQATLSKFENNGQAPSLKILIKLCNRIGLPLVDLFSSMNVATTKIKEELAKAEFYLITSEYEQLAALLSQIEVKLIDEPALKAQYDYLKGFEMNFNEAAITDVLFQFDQLLMNETAEELFDLLAYTGIGLVYAREEEWAKAEFYVTKVFEKIYTYPIKTIEDTWRVLNIVFHCGVFYAKVDDLETSDTLLNYVLAICSDNHLTYYLARAAAQLTENAIREQQPKETILEMLHDARAYAKINKNVKLLAHLKAVEETID